MIKNYVPKPLVGRRFAIGDIHGCLETFRTMVYDKIQLTHEDQLFLLGDYVNRGPDSLGVLDFIMKLQANNYQVYPICGNHEKMFLEDYGDRLAEKYRLFLENLPYYYVTEDFYFVHAEFNFAAEDPLEDTSTMIWDIGYTQEPDLAFLAGKKVVHGHKVHTLSDIFDAIMDRAPMIPLDNGCYKGTKYTLIAKGNLCALNLNEMKLLVQENVEVDISYFS